MEDALKGCPCGISIIIIWHRWTNLGLSACQCQAQGTKHIGTCCRVLRGTVEDDLDQLLQSLVLSGFTSLVSAPSRAGAYCWCAVWQMRRGGPRWPLDCRQITAAAASCSAFAQWSTSYIKKRKKKWSTSYHPCECSSPSRRGHRDVAVLAKSPQPDAATTTVEEIEATWPCACRDRILPSFLCPAKGRAERAKASRVLHCTVLCCHVSVVNRPVHALNLNLLRDGLDWIRRTWICDRCYDDDQSFLSRIGRQRYLLRPQLRLFSEKIHCMPWKKFHSLLSQ